MSIQISTNIDSLKAQNQLSKISTSLSKSFEKLSSGLRINTASDDPAGLAMANKLMADARIANTAIRNANDGVSIAAIADSAMNEIGSILMRMGELAEQSANGTYTNTQRSALSLEFTALGSEINRIAATTSFNSINLLSNSSSIVLQVGLDGSSSSQISITSVTATLDSLGLATSGSSALSFSIIANTTSDAQSSAQNALTAINSAITSLSSKRGTLGAVESRLTSAINSLTSARENFLAAESRIRDADIAAEVANMVRLQVLQQSTMAVIAQANQQPARILSLLN